MAGKSYNWGFQIILCNEVKCGVSLASLVILNHFLAAVYLFFSNYVGNHAELKLVFLCLQQHVA